jgi:hypothetical protein
MTRATGGIPDTPGQRVLLVTPQFFGYERAIADEIGRQGHAVELVDERPGNSALTRALLRVLPVLARRQVRRHYHRLTAEHTAQPYDVVLAVKAETVPESFLARLREASPDARFVIYTFDSFRNSPRAARLRDRFDAGYSFDPVDTRADPRFDYLPLFYSDPFRARRKTEPSYDLSFVGTMHSDRYAWIRDVLAYAARPYTFLHVQAGWYFWLRRLTDRRWSRLRRQDVSTDKLSLSEVAEVFSSSRAVLDVQRSGQVGLTMRTFEVLAAGAALVTTNRTILDEPCYRPDSVFVLDAERGVPPDLGPWLERCAPVEPSVIAPYSLEAWVSRLLAGAAGPS